MINILFPGFDGPKKGGASGTGGMKEADGFQAILQKKRDISQAE